MVEDAELLEAWAHGDQEAGATLVERHSRLVYAFFRSKVDDDLDDLIQETWLACVASRAKFRGDSTFRTYVLGIARNRLYEHFRRQQRARRHIDFDEVSAVALGSSPTGRLARGRRQSALMAGLRNIPVDSQIVLELFYWEDLSGGEIAAVLGIPENTVRTRVNRARQQLRDRIGSLPEEFS
ncbi:MAG: sigma-70 family RNA polymerase sigma factor [Myxococcota bacterium]